MALTDQAHIFEMTAAGYVAGCIAARTDNADLDTEHDSEGNYTGAVTFTLNGKRFRLPSPTFIGDA